MGYIGNEPAEISQTFSQISPAPSSSNTGKVLLSSGSSADYTGILGGFKNKIINGNFDLWQRGTSLAAASAIRYLADRWVTQAGGSTVAPSQQSFTLGQTIVPGEPTFFHRSVVASVAGASNFVNKVQKVEGVRTFASQTCILSFWAKADANRNIAVEFSQNFGTGGAPSAEVTGIGVTIVPLTTTFQKFTVSVSLPSISGKTLGTNVNNFLGIIFWFDAGSSFNSRTNSLGQQSGTFDIAQVQFELGAVATPFEQRSLAEELAMCQRFYSTGGASDTTIFSFNATAASQFQYSSVYFPVTMRANPTVVLTAGSVSNVTGSPTVNSAATSGFGWFVTSTASGNGFASTVWTADSEI